jgi:hypothetical protein
MAAAAALTPAEQAELRGQCTAFLAGHGPVTSAAMLAGIPADTVPDRYGDGGVVAELEAEVAGLPLMPAYLSHARQIAAALRGVPGVRVIPDPPQVPMMHLLLDTTQDGFTAAARRLAAEQQIWTWASAMVTADPGVQRVELSVGDATCALPPEQVRGIIAALAAP